MKRIAMLVIALFMMSVSVPVFAADEMTKEQKDECLLASKDCMGQIDTIQEKIVKLQGEIKKGDKVYSAEELKKLNDKLKEANDLLDNLMKP
jgi:peptidoglycan hydrolase CwlO-like protein